MPKKIPFTSHKQQGATIIGLMVGTLVSLIAILGSLSLYKSLTQTSVDATFDTKHDGNVAIALTRITNLVQNAGFGLSKPTTSAESHILLNGQTLYWRAREINSGSTFDPEDTTTYTTRCYKLSETTVATENEKQIQIDSATCNEALSLTAIAAAWPTANPKKEVVNRTSLNRLSTTYRKDKDKINLLNIAVSGPTVNCSPYGMISAPAGQPYTNTTVTFSHFTSTDLNKITDQDNITQAHSLSHKVCIGNPVQ